MTKKRMSPEVVQYIIARDRNSCIICGSTDGIQLAHIRSRGSYPSLIDDPSNVCCLCYNCHMIRQHQEGTITREVLERRMEELYGDQS